MSLPPGKFTSLPDHVSVLWEIFCAFRSVSVTSLSSLCAPWSTVLTSRSGFVFTSQFSSLSIQVSVLPGQPFSLPVHFSVLPSQSVFLLPAHVSVLLDQFSSLPVHINYMRQSGLDESVWL